MTQGGRGRVIAFALMAVAILVVVWVGLALAGKWREPPARRAPQAAGVRRATVKMQVNEERNGLSVSAVARGGPAERGGLRSGDVLRAVSGASVNTLDELARAIQEAEPGVELRVTVLRGGREVGLTLVPE